MKHVKVRNIETPYVRFDIQADSNYLRVHRLKFGNVVKFFW